MKRNRHLQSFFLLLLTSVFAYMTWYYAFREKKYEDNGNRRFMAILKYNMINDGDIEAGIQAADSEFGTFTKIRTYNVYDWEEQKELLELADKITVDGIITVGEPEEEEINEKLKEIHTLGIPVVLVDADSNDSDRKCYVGTNNYRAGQMAAEELLKETESNLRVLVIVSKLTHANQQERLQGFWDTLSKAEEAEIIAIEENYSDKARTQQILKRVLRQHQETNAIFCAEASGTMETAVWFSNEEVRKVKIVGFDAVESILNGVKNGLIDATIIQNGFDMGYQAVKYLNDMAKESDEQMEIYTECVCVTKENVNKYLE